MSVEAARALFVDTSAFYARADKSDGNHDRAARCFEAIKSGELPYRPLYTSQAVCSELVTLLCRKVGHEQAVTVLTAIQEAESIAVLPVDRPTFAAATGQFSAYDDHQISFVDHTTGVLADHRDVDHVFSFDDDFRILDFRLVPDDVATR